jgi:outer membrane protein assembly factor BamE (lipoprotein component of BamABCDE complex)
VNPLKRIACLAIAVALPACFSVRGEFGNVIHPSSVEAILPGVTTRAEVTALFGPPSAFFKPSLLDMIFGGQPETLDAPVVEDVYTYRHVETRTQLVMIPILYASVTAADRSTTLTVFFDSDGVVRYYGFRVDDNIDPPETNGE